MPLPIHANAPCAVRIPLSSSTPLSPSTMAVTIDHTAFPDIIDLILKHSPPSLLLAFRGASKEYRDRIDKDVNHVVLQRTLPTRRIPGITIFRRPTGEGWTVKHSSKTLFLPSAVSTLDLQDGTSGNFGISLSLASKFTSMTTLRRFGYKALGVGFNNRGPRLVQTVVDHILVNDIHWSQSFCRGPVRAAKRYILHLAWRRPDFEPFMWWRGDNAFPDLEHFTLVAWPLNHPARERDSWTIFPGNVGVEKILRRMTQFGTRGGRVTFAGLDELRCSGVPVLKSQYKSLIERGWAGHYTPAEVDDVCSRIEFLSYTEWLNTLSDADKELVGGGDWVGSKLGVMLTNRRAALRSRSRALPGSSSLTSPVPIGRFSSRLRLKPTVLFHHIQHLPICGLHV